LAPKEYLAWYQVDFGARADKHLTVETEPEAKEDPEEAVVEDNLVHYVTMALEMEVQAAAAAAKGAKGEQEVMVGELRLGCS
jgi:uncharacterized glyoxalase superfamily protein PhnB